MHLWAGFGLRKLARFCRNVKIVLTCEDGGDFAADVVREEGVGEAARHLDCDLGVAAHGAGRTQSEGKDDESVFHVLMLKERITLRLLEPYADRRRRRKAEGR